MKLDFKGIIAKDELEKDITNLDEVIKKNEYAIIVENGIGKYVVFDIDYVKNNLDIKNSSSNQNKPEKSPFTLVESMIQTLEELPDKKTTAIMLSSLVSKYYGKTVSPVVIRTRAEENANNQNEVNYFDIEPGNIIGLAKGSSFEKYMLNKMKRAIEYEMNKLFQKEDQIELNTILYRVNRIIDSTLYQKYSKDFTNKDIKNMILNTGKYKIDNNYVIVKRYL